MKYLALYLLPLLLLLLSFNQAHAQDAADSTQEYYGADHNEADLTIAGKLVMVQAAVPTSAQIDAQIRSQMRYMLGLMRSRAGTAAALYPKYTYKVTDTKKNGGQYNIQYELKGRGVFLRGVSQYTFTIPLNPRAIWEASQKKCMVEQNVEESFYWYHWEPLIAGCPLKENVDYYNFRTAVQPRANTQQSFPEYAKLVDAEKNIKMTMFFGLSTYDSTNWTPENTEDWGVKGLNLQRAFLKSLGFAETIWTRDQVERIYRPKSAKAPVPYVVEMNYKGAQASIRIRLILSDTGLQHGSAAFHTFLKPALAQESVIVYDGHSGIGKNMDLNAIERMRGIKLPLNPKYQILFLGSCVPYAYYPDIFFSRKKTAADPNGTLNLDIFTYAQESIFGNEQDHGLTQALVRFAGQGYKTSFQEIIGNQPHFYFGINGDEDNPKTR